MKMYKKVLLALVLCVSLLLSASLIFGATSQVEVVYETSTGYFRGLTVNPDSGDPLLALDAGESRKFIDVTYPYNLLVDIEAELNAESIYLSNTSVIDGNLKVWGNISLGEVDVWESENSITFNDNVTADNIFLQQSIYCHTQENLSVSAIGHWQNVTFDEESAGFHKGILHDHDSASNDTFVIQEDGTYFSVYTIGIVDIQANPTNVVTIRLTKNNEEIHGSAFEEDTTRQNKHISIHHFAVFNAVVGDEIKFQFTGDSTTIYMETLGTYGEHPDSASIFIEKGYN